MSQPQTYTQRRDAALLRTILTIGELTRPTRTQVFGRLHLGVRAIVEHRMARQGFPITLQAITNGWSAFSRRLANLVHPRWRTTSVNRATVAKWAANQAGYAGYPAPYTVWPAPGPAPGLVPVPVPAPGPAAVISAAASSQLGPLAANLAGPGGYQGGQHPQPGPVTPQAGSVPTHKPPSLDPGEYNRGYRRAMRDIRRPRNNSRSGAVARWRIQTVSMLLTSVFALLLFVVLLVATVPVALVDLVALALVRRPKKS